MTWPVRLSSLASALILGASLGAAGCRNCGETADHASPEAGPTMPTGMLAAWSDSGGAAPGPLDAAERLSTARRVAGGEWAELQVAGAVDTPDRTTFVHWQPDSRFLSLDAMTLLHESFARALPGFDLFLPRLLDAAALGRLRTELGLLKTQVAALQTARAAKARWGEASSLIAGLSDDSGWVAARNAFLRTIDELLELAADLGAKGQGLWVLGI